MALRIVIKKEKLEKNMGLIASGNTDIGRKRKTNQDSFHIGLESKINSTHHN